MTLNLPYLRRLFLLAITFVCLVVATRGQDLPGASANLQTAPAGTIVIAMDSVNQACSVINPFSNSYLFNLKAYGLAVFLLNLDYDLKWVITAGKTKDAIDFTASAERFAPSYIAPQSRDFRVGPILIFPPDTIDIVSAIDFFNAALPDSSKVNVYRLESAVTVDVRYTLAQRPKIALLHDSCNIHQGFLESASVPTMNYTCLQEAVNLVTGCYTFVSEPHVGDSPVEVPYIESDSIYNFVMAGGNFLSECEGVPTFELRKKFQSVNGQLIEPPNAGANNFNILSNIIYGNPDMAYAQYHGTFKPHTRGAFRTWRFAYGNANANNFYSVTSSKRNVNDSIWQVATVSKMTSDLGSLVFYLGNHEYYTEGCYQCDTVNNAINTQEVNGIRLYLNAALIPSKIPDCLLQTPLAVQLSEFTANKKNNDAVQLLWSTVSEEEDAVYFIEHSVTGSGFKMISKLEGRGNSTNGDEYAFLHTDPVKGINYYRLRIISQSGKLTYSEIRKVVFGNKDLTLNLYPNPATGKTILLLDVKDGSRIRVSFYDASGRQVKQTIVTIRNQQSELNVDGLQNGVYWIIASTSDGEQFSSKLQVHR